MNTPIDGQCITTIRMLAADMVEQANSGHPGLPLGAAPMAYVLWTRFLKHNPADPAWPNRDRFLLSAGHGSALLYALLHLAGYELPLEELKHFRQWESMTPGHPEADCAPGVEVTTGPLGQGFAMGVGMAIAERHLATRYAEHAPGLVDHYTYAICSDGDLMEGVASEAASLAGHLKLGKLVYLYDDNHISIDGSTELAFTEEVGRRFESYGWQVLRVDDGNDLAAIEAAIREAREESGRPSLIAVRTHIGFGSPKQDDAGVHGSPLGAEALKATKAFYGWPQEPRFHVPDEVRAHFAAMQERWREAEEGWLALFEEFKLSQPDRAEAYEMEIEGRLPDDWEEAIPIFSPGEAMATRKASGTVINAIAPVLPNFMGGSADLAPSNNTLIRESADFEAETTAGRNIRFGVREHAMGGIVNGMARHGGMLPYGATFHIFSDYMRPAIRIAALMRARSVFVFTHDSVGLGEDGPTHQPIEQLASLRAMPNLTVLRPADANETAAAWHVALEHEGPTALALTRQGVPVLDPERFPLFDGVRRGAYVLSDCEGAAELLLIGTGSEVHLLLMAQERLAGEGVAARVVSMPSWELFAEQSPEYRDAVLPPSCTARLAVEAGATFGWERWVGDRGAVIGIDRFGASAPGQELLAHFGFTVEHICERARDLLR